MREAAIAAREAGRRGRFVSGRGTAYLSSRGARIDGAQGKECGRLEEGQPQGAVSGREDGVRNLLRA